jgi:cell division protein ZapA (FtsZ GTPase activity inhibitor)
MSRSVQVNLGGKVFNLGSADPEEHVQACAALVNERLDELRKKGAPDATIGLFVAMTIADDLLKLKKSNAESGAAMRSHLKALRKAAG